MRVTLKDLVLLEEELNTVIHPKQIISLKNIAKK